MKVVIALGIIAIFLRLSLLMREIPREAAREIACANHLKQIMLGLQNYQEEYHAFPPAYTVDASGKPLHSWRTLILPFFEQEELHELYRSIDLTKPWNDPANAIAAAKTPSVYDCYSALYEGLDHGTTFRAIVGPDACFLPIKSRRLDEIIDPHEATVAIIDAPWDKAIPWMSPIDADEAFIHALPESNYLQHLYGTNAAMVDGSVRLLKTGCPREARHAFVTISGKDADLTKEW